MRRQFAAATFALSMGLVAGLSTASAYSADPEQRDNAALNGERALGVDISDVGLTSSAIQQFLAALPPGGQQGVIGGCAAAAVSQGASRSDARLMVLPFCELIPGAPSLQGDFAPFPPTAG